MFQTIARNWVRAKMLWRQEKKQGTSSAGAELKMWGAAILCVVSIILTVMNVSKGYWLMAKSTGILIAGFAVSSILCNWRQWVKLADAIMLVMVLMSFTLYAITGQNEGFAILWILLIPALAPNLLNLRYGVFASVYFQILLIVMFYTPLKSNFVNYYTETFMIRFPVLYFAAFISSLYIVFELKYYQYKTDRLARVDGLTQLANRREFQNMLDELAEDKLLYQTCTFVSFDLNDLKTTNDTIGHAAGDEMIMAAAKLIEGAIEGALIVARIGGDEFMAITTAEENTLKNQLNNLSNNIAVWKGTMVDRLSISHGYACVKDNPELDIKGMIELADKKMYEDKARYYKQTGKERRRSGL